ncbi:unnamed protein product [Ilex paraguariensis]|uniref:Serine-threonine/tyrosine-protein kinase catalytic domain-containing protein n=1 Tax=Ilex paraguariensis TaxID=185542 RepID=A0ABC8QSS5_9AQUA
MENLLKLQFVSIGHNMLGSGGPDDLGFLTSLTTATSLRMLDMEHNKLGGTLPASISNLSTNLELKINLTVLFCFRVLNQDGTIVAIKILNLLRQGASKSFLAECEALRNIRHRNLVKVATACSGADYQGNDFKALVYEFMVNGNLEEWLHPIQGEFEVNEEIGI